MEEDNDLSRALRDGDALNSLLEMHAAEVFTAFFTAFKEASGVPLICPLKSSEEFHPLERLPRYTMDEAMTADPDPTIHAFSVQMAVVIRGQYDHPVGFCLPLRLCVGTIEARGVIDLSPYRKATTPPAAPPPTPPTPNDAAVVERTLEHDQKLNKAIELVQLTAGNLSPWLPHKAPGKPAPQRPRAVTASPPAALATTLELGSKKRSPGAGSDDDYLLGFYSVTDSLYFPIFRESRRLQLKALEKRIDDLGRLGSSDTKTNDDEIKRLKPDIEALAPWAPIQPKASSTAGGIAGAPGDPADQPFLPILQLPHHPASTALQKAAVDGCSNATEALAGTKQTIDALQQKARDVVAYVRMAAEGGKLEKGPGASTPIGRFLTPAFGGGGTLLKQTPRITTEWFGGADQPRERQEGQE